MKKFSDLNPHELVLVFHQEFSHTLVLNANLYCRRYNIPMHRAREFVSDLFLKVFEKHKLFAEGVDLRGIAYLVESLKNEFLQSFRKPIKEIYNEDLVNMLPAVDTEVEFEKPKAIAEEDLIKYFDELLPEKQFLVLMLIIEGLEPEAIAEELGIKTEQVYVRLNRARDKLSKFHKKAAFYYRRKRLTAGRRAKGTLANPRKVWEALQRSPVVYV